jgi:hypothetical protein
MAFNLTVIVFCALAVIGVFVFWCDVTGAWDDMARRIRALLPPFSK